MKLLLFLSLVSLALAIRFDGDQVLTLYPNAPSHLRLIKEFESYDNFADFWSPDNAASVQIGGAVDIRFPNRFLRMVKKKLTGAKMQFDVKIDDIQRLIDTQFDMPRGTKAHGYNVYNTYEEIMGWTTTMVNSFPNLITYEDLEISEEGRPIPQLTLKTGEGRSIILIDCGIHAREWVSPAFCQYFVNEMATKYGQDADVTSMLDKFTFVVMPVLNVDGYSYSHTDDRMWRKTRSNYGNTVCYGVDPNRNFDAGWSGPGASGSPCSDTYYGPVVESEKLTQGLSNFIRANQGNIEAYLTFHSYSQVMLWPYSYAEKDVNNFEEHAILATDATAALQAVHGTKYTSGAGWDIFYLAAGGSDDMAKDYGVPLSYTIELRDTGRYGFVLPERLIQPTCEETFELVRVVGKHLLNK